MSNNNIYLNHRQIKTILSILSNYIETTPECELRYVQVVSLLTSMIKMRKVLDEMEEADAYTD